eukprot:5649049-Alexandrium_andersonii.AAC.1
MLPSHVLRTTGLPGLRGLAGLMGTWPQKVVAVKQACRQVASNVGQWRYALPGGAEEAWALWAAEAERALTLRG